jgi:membrane-associated protein
LQVRIQLFLTAVLLALALAITLLMAQASLQAVSTLQQQQTFVAADDPSSIGSWMTLPYIAQVYHVPENDLYHALHLQRVRQDQQTPLSGLALGSHRSVKALIIEVQVTIQIYRNFHPPQGGELLSSLLSWLVTCFEQSGYPLLWLIVFVASVGAPVPVSLLLLAAGAFAALGDFHLGVLTFMSVSASVCGDSTGYAIGRRFGRKALGWIEQRSWSGATSSRTIARSRAAFQRRGGWAVFLSRFLFSALGGTINLVAGTEHYPYQRFLLYDALGETIGALLPLALGYVFGASWEDLGDLLSTVSGFVLALVFTGFLLIRLLTLLQRLKALDGEQRDSFASPQLQRTQKETVTVR